MNRTAVGSIIVKSAGKIAVFFVLLIIGASVIASLAMHVANAAEVRLITVDFPAVPGSVPVYGEDGKGPIAILYNAYLLALVCGGFLVFGSILWGAIKHMVQPGDPHTLSDLKERSVGGLLGLLMLGGGGVLLLRTINPDLATLQLPFMERLKPPPKFEGPPDISFSSSTAWQAIQSTAVQDPGLQRTLSHIQKAMTSGQLWPDFNLADHALVIVDGRSAPSTEYCLGRCVAGRNEALWQRVTLNGATRGRPPNGLFTFANAQSFGIEGQDTVMALWYRDYKEAVTVAIHEDFHNSYQPRYDDDTLEGRPSSWTRQTLENGYAQRPAVLSSLRKECRALVSALRSGSRAGAIAPLREFVAAREARRSQAGAPDLEENGWERNEGMAQFVEHRAGIYLGITEPGNLIHHAIHRGLCDTFPGSAYLSLLGGLQAMALDAFGDRNWPSQVYAAGNSRSLYGLVKEIARR